MEYPSFYSARFYLIDVVLDTYFLAEIAGISSIAEYFNAINDAHFCMTLYCFLGSVLLGTLLNNIFCIRYLFHLNN